MSGPDRFVIYHRVSTAQQGRSGLGLEAQARATTDYIEQVGGEQIGEDFVEVETGKVKNRPVLAAAITLAKRECAILLVAKLDRLARNVAFVSQLQESGVRFRAADMPEANEFMVHVLAAVAQYEAKMISDRTKAGMASRKARGLPLGNPENLRRGNSEAARQNKADARALAERGYHTETGGDWHPTTVHRLQRRPRDNQREAAA